MVNEAFRLFFCNCIKGSPVQLAMPHFFFHLHHGKARVEDRSGVALPDAEAAWYHAYRNARDLIADAGRERGQWGQQIVEVVDERGGHVWTMPLSEVVELTT